MSVAAISAISPLVTTSHPPTNLLGGSGRDHFRRRSRRTYRERGNETVNGLPERGDVHADSLDLRADSVNVSHNSGKIHVVIQALTIASISAGVISVSSGFWKPHGLLLSPFGYGLTLMCACDVWGELPPYGLHTHGCIVEEKILRL